MDKYENLLTIWCDRLISLQIRGYGAPHDGGFLCPACTAIHGRADNAFYPFLYLYQKSGDPKYYNAALSVFDFHERMLTPEKAAYNDLNNLWTGITAFSAIGYYKALTKTAEAMTPELKARTESRFKDAAGWALRHLSLSAGLSTNINYYAAAAALFADCGIYFHDEVYMTESRRLIDYCLRHCSENGLLVGEGTPHDALTPHGCRPVDLGYDIEESLPCLTEAAEALGDETLLQKLAALMLQNLDFILPDGGIDNSFGTRNNKWTYYGSRTSDGCLAALMTLGKYEPLLFEAAYRNADLLIACTADGLLHGGPHYAKLGLKPCMHHSLCHAVALADALQIGLSETHRSGLGRMPLPCEDAGPRLRHYPEIAAYRLVNRRFIATVTAYDFRGPNFDNGASHASGGTLTLLYDKENGPAIAGSTLDYQLTEALNMQAPNLILPHASLIPRLEIGDGADVYSSALENEVTLAAEETADGARISAIARKYTCLYDFFDDALEITVRLRNPQDIESAVFILPMITGSASVDTENDYTTRNIYWLSGGFLAKEYRLRPDEKGRFRIRIF